LTAFVVPLLVMAYYYLKFVRRMDLLRPFRPISRMSVTHLSAATISRDLLPRFNPHVSKDTVIKVVGGDGVYVSGPHGLNWRRGLNTWLRKGAIVEIVLVDPTDEVWAAYSKLSACSDRLRLYRISDKKERHASLVRKYRTFHPTILRSAEVKLLWLENFHPPGCHTAYDIEYYSSVLGTLNEEDFGEYQRQIDELIARSVPLKTDLHAMAA